MIGRNRKHSKLVRLSLLPKYVPVADHQHLFISGKLTRHRLHGVRALCAQRQHARVAHTHKYTHIQSQKQNKARVSSARRRCAETTTRTYTARNERHGAVLGVVDELEIGRQVAHRLGKVRRHQIRHTICTAVSATDSDRSLRQCTQRRAQSHKQLNLRADRAP